MVFLSLREVIDLAFMTGVVGYIFLDIFKVPKEEHYDPLKPKSKWNDFIFACLITAPAIIFHEMAHKFVGMFYGLQATFHASYGWLGIGLLLKLFNTGIIFFVPGYVSLSPSGPLQTAITAAAGPLLNLILFVTATILLKSKITFTQKWMAILALTKRINLFLFIFNMLPFGFFDGAKVLSGLLAFFG